MPRPRSSGILSRLRAARRRRGALGATIAVSSAALFGMAGLAIEGGHWLLTRRNAQNAADMAALAAARLLDGSRDNAARSAAVAAAREVATRNGFTDGTAGATVTVNLNAGGNDAAVEVIVARDITTVLTRLVPAVGNTVTPAGRAVSVAEVTNSICILGQRQVRMKSGTSYDFINCVVHSNGPNLGNNTDTMGIWIESMSGTGIRAPLMSSVDDTCHGCSTWSATAPFMGSSRRITNPYAFLDPIGSANWPLPSNACPARANDQAPLVPNCVYGPGSEMKLASTTGLILSPGTYYFDRRDLSIESNQGLTCNGCTFVFTSGIAANAGRLSIKSNQNLNFVAPVRSDADPALNGTLFVRPERPGQTGEQEGSAGVNIESNTDMVLLGGQYFGQSWLNYKSNTRPGGQPCNGMVAGVIVFDSITDLDIDVSGCPAMNTPTAAIRATRLTQ